MRSWRRLIALAAIIGLLAGGYYLSFRKGRLDDVRPRDLLVSAPPMPTTVPSRLGTVREASDRPWWCGIWSTAQTRIWDDGSELASPFVIETVCRYISPLHAQIKYRLSSPEDMFGDYGGNFESPRAPQADIYPPPSEVGSFAASEFQIVCGLGSARGGTCSAWMYRGRYGQYSVDVSYLSDGGLGVSLQQFLALAKAADAAVAQRLGLAS